MRILHVIAETDPGGAERVVLHLAAASQARGDQVAVAASPGAWRGRLEAAGVVFHPVPLAHRSVPASARAGKGVAQALRQFRPTVIHSHNVRATAVAWVALRTAWVPAPLLATVHGLAPADYRWASRILRLSGARVVACAPGVERALVGAGLPPARVQVVLNGAALDPAGPPRQELLRQRLGLSSDPLVVGVGRLDPEKNWSLLIEAAARVNGAQFVVAGDGPLRESLESQAASRGGRVRFVGRVDDVAALLGQASCLVSTSDREGLSMALLEGLASGTPAVVTSVDGLADVLPAGAALLVPCGDVEALAAGVRRVLTEPALSRSLVAGGRDAARRWTPAALTTGYQQLYDRLQAEGPGRFRGW